MIAVSNTMNFKLCAIGIINFKFCHITLMIIIIFYIPFRSNFYGILFIQNRIKNRLFRYKIILSSMNFRFFFICRFPTNENLKLHFKF